jgi:peptidoglycan/xylan/chitin deacetylase (PgdA/CDA1 family)
VALTTELPQPTSSTLGTPAPETTVAQPPPSLPAIPAPRPGRAQVVTAAPAPTRQIAITIDDGYCEECVAGYVDFAERTGVPLTLSPNGSFHGIWDRYAGRLSPLIAAGQVQIGNHTWSHPDLVTRSDTAIRAEIERNEAWIEKTFGVTSRPYFRPPFGRHNSRTDGVAAGLGYTKILMWNATLGDATEETPAELMALASKWIRPGAIVLGHANHPTVIHLFDQIQAIIAQRGLQPVTLDTMFGTSRSAG